MASKCLALNRNFMELSFILRTISIGLKTKCKCHPEFLSARKAISVKNLHLKSNHFQPSNPEQSRSSRSPDHRHLRIPPNQGAIPPEKGSECAKHCHDSMTSRQQGMTYAKDVVWEGCVETYWDKHLSKDIISDTNLDKSWGSAFQVVSLNSQESSSTLVPLLIRRLQKHAATVIITKWVKNHIVLTVQIEDLKALRLSVHCMLRDPQELFILTDQAPTALDVSQTCTTL